MRRTFACGLAEPAYSHTMPLMATAFCNLRWLTAGALFLGFALLVSATAASAQPASPIHVSSEAGLVAMPSTHAIAVRDGFYVAGDSPSLPYTASTAACPLNSGAGDGGSQAPTSDGGCWIANFAGIQPDPTIWGAKPSSKFGATASGTTLTVTILDSGPIAAGQTVLGPGITGSPTIVTQLTGTAGGVGTYQLSGSETVGSSEVMFGAVDSHTAVQAAVTAIEAVGGVLYTGNSLFALSSQVSIALPMKLLGPRSNQTGGFIPTTTNESLFLLTNYVSIEGVYVNMAGPGISTSGTVFTLPATVLGQPVGSRRLAENLLEQACIGVDINGVVDVVENNTFNDEAGGSGCHAIRVGASTTGGSTLDPKIVKNVIGPLSGNPAHDAVLILDTGGIHELDNTIVAGFVNGTAIQPGAGQTVQYGFFRGEMGDTETGVALLIDPTSSTANVYDLNFTQSWEGASGAQNILIENPSGASIFAGFHFTANRSGGAGTNGVEIDAGTDFSYESGDICASSESSPGTYYGLLVASGVAKINLQGNTIGDGCDGLTGAAGTAAALHFGGATTATLVLGNDFTSESNPATIITGTLPSDMPFVSRICSNPGYIVPWNLKWNGGCDPQAAVALANSATQALPPGSGDVTVELPNIGQSAQFLISGGSVAAGPNTGSTIVHSSTPTANQVGIYWDGTNYDIKMGSTAATNDGPVNAAMSPITKSTN
jgi:hypothetical protein